MVRSKNIYRNVTPKTSNGADDDDDDDDDDVFFTWTKHFPTSPAIFENPRPRFLLQSCCLELVINGVK